MKRLWLITSFVALVVVLSGCVILFSPSPIFNATVRTDFQDSGVYYICEDVNTLMTYEFRFRESLIGWRSYLLGVDSGEIGYDRTLSFGSPDVTVAGDRVTYRFIINAGTAPLSVDPQAVAPQAIIVELGSARLVLEASASDGSIHRAQSAPITIRSNCP